MISNLEFSSTTLLSVIPGDKDLTENEKEKCKTRFRSFDFDFEFDIQVIKHLLNGFPSQRHFQKLKWKSEKFET